MELGLEADTSSSMSDLEKKALERRRRLEQMKEQMGRGNTNGSNSTEEGRREYGIFAPSFLANNHSLSSFSGAR